MASLPAPFGGWNAKDGLDLMPETDAIRMVNLFPDQEGIKLRNGFRSHSTGLGGAVQTLAEYATPSGTRHLIGGANNKLWNATTYNAAATDITGGATITVNKWQTCNFRASGTTYLILMNGTDQPLSWDGTTLASATYTGSGLTDDNLIQPNSFRNRLYAVEKNTTRFWYGGVDAATGALTSFDVGSLFKRGGKLLWTASWSRDGGRGPEDYLVVCSSLGEVLLYSGDYPGGSWYLTGRYFVPTPLGQRSYFNMDGELVILTLQGAVPMSEVVRQGDSTQSYPKVTDKITTAFNTAAKDYLSYFGWEGFLYPRGHQLLVNVPTIENSTANQYVMNLYTGAWCKYTGINAICWSTLNEKPYFGASDGKVYEFDTTQADNGAYINFDLKGAFTYLGDRARLKRFLNVTPIMLSDPNVTFQLDVDTDFSDRVITSTVTTVGTSSASAWDSSPWDTTQWAGSQNTHRVDRYAVSGIGRNVAIRLKGSSKNVGFSISAFNILYEAGGI